MIDISRWRRDLASTFFVIPTKGDAGVDSEGRTKRKRASRYALTDIADDLKKLLSANREIAVHGIDAWRDSAKGRDEREQIQKITGTAETGVRMHWLYFDSQAPATLEKAGFSYDSTVGYNETIGYRAGTTQVFKHPEVDHLLELPLHIMDTALFYPSYMNLSDDEARAAMLPLIENVTRFGGVLTINWHDRSLGPERLWGRRLCNSATRLARPDALVCYSLANRLVVSQAARGIVRQDHSGWRKCPRADQRLIQPPLAFRH